MVDVLFNNDDITVLGPPETLEVLVDIGPAGQRGSQFFVGAGNPNSISIGQTPELNDLFLNTSPGGQYGYIYQYLAQPGGNTWVKVIDIFPTTYSINYAVTFVAGVGEAVIPVADIVTVTGAALTAANFSVQYSIVHSNPIASSMTIPPLVGAGDNLVIDFKAIEYASSTWSALDEEVTVHINITIVPS